MRQRYTIQGIENNLIDPPDEPDDGPECEECGKEMDVTERGKQGEYWWYEAKCECGHQIKNDNF